MRDDAKQVWDDRAASLGGGLFWMNGLIVFVAGLLHMLVCQQIVLWLGGIEPAWPWLALVTLALAALAGAAGAWAGRRQARALGALALAARLASAAQAEPAGVQIEPRLGHDLRARLNAILNFTRFLSKERYGTLTARQQELQQRVLANAEQMLAAIDALFAGASAAPDLPAPELLSAPEPSAPPEPAASGRPTVIVVDDDVNSQAIIGDYLGQLGCAVVAVHDSRQAIARIRQARPDLVILDVLMPHLDGWEVLAQLKTLPDLRPIPVLICSVIEHQRLAIALGADDYLVKPIAEAALITRVRRLIAPQATVLVIDDDPDARQIVRMALEESPYRVIEAADGRTGLAAVAAARPSLVILDMMLPGLDGFAALEQLRADPRHAGLAVLVLTARALDAAERAALRAHNAHYLRKGSLSAETLRDRLTRLISAPDPGQITPPQET